MTPGSRILFNQDVRTRVQSVAPFLVVDSNPYPVIDRGRLEWVVDAYTTSSEYPYSEGANTSALPPGSNLGGSYNYVRNSVVATVDAYDGNVTLYALDSADPILQAWEGIYPDMFKPLSGMDAQLQQHLRYPQNLLSVEASMYGRYHVAANPAGASIFYGNSVAWQVAQTGAGNSTAPVQPLYQLLALPGQSSPTFGTFVPLTPQSGRLLAAIGVAACDVADYGHLTFYEVPPAPNVRGPALANAAVNGNPTVSRLTTLLDQHGSSVVFGPTLAIPIEDSLLYVRPMFVNTSYASSAIPLPQYHFIVAVWGNNVGIAPTLLGKGGALEMAIGPAVASVGSNPTTNLPAAITQEIDHAQQLQAAAYRALRHGDFALFGRDIAAVNSELALVKRQLAELAHKKGSGGPTTTTTTTTTTLPSSGSSTTTTRPPTSSSSRVGGA